MRQIRTLFVTIALLTTVLISPSNASPAMLWNGLNEDQKTYYFLGVLSGMRIIAIIEFDRGDNQAAAEALNMDGYLNSHVADTVVFLNTFYKDPGNFDTGFDHAIVSVYRSMSHEGKNGLNQDHSMGARKTEDGKTYEWNGTTWNRADQ